MKLLMFGPPGSGKGTYASRLSRELGVPHISTGELVRDEIKNQTDIGREIQSYSKRGQLVPDEIISRLLETRIAQPDCAKGFILDGFPRTVPQAEALERIASPELVINLDVPDSVAIERLSTRLTCRTCGAIYNERFLKPRVDGICDKCDGKLYKRDDDRPDVIRERLKVYQKQTQPLLDFYGKKKLVQNITNNEADVPPDIIVREIMNIIRSDSPSLEH